jgi:uncharacterized protein YqgC (DUF456 family)
MNYLCAILLAALNAVWLVLVVLGLPGTWLMVGSTVLVAWWRWAADPSRPMFGVPVLVAICVLALAGETSELLAGMLGSKVAGGSRRAALGALVGALGGGVLGTFFIPIPIPFVGSLLGTCGGAAVGAWGLELTGGRTARVSLKAGLGAGAGRLIGTVVKLAAGVGIWIIVTIAAFWP